jgi:ribosome-binding factor A
VIGHQSLVIHRETGSTPSMPSHRSLRIAEAIREVVSSAILFEVADPRVHSVTVLRVEVTADLRNATVYVSIMGNETERRQTYRGLIHAAGFLQARVAARLQTRFTPILSFKHDESVKKSMEVSRLIDQALASDQRPAKSLGEPVPSPTSTTGVPVASSVSFDHAGEDTVPENT